MIPLNQKSNEFEGLKQEFSLFQHHTQPIKPFLAVCEASRDFNLELVGLRAGGFPLNSSQLYVTPGKEIERFK